MAYKCDNCGKGVAHGHAVSHAKNRTQRLFKPNLQKLKVMKNNLMVRVKFCTSCIKRLKKDGHTGVYNLFKIKVKKEEVKIPIVKEELQAEKKAGKKVELKKVKVEKLQKKEPDAKEKMRIEDIVGKKG